MRRTGILLFAALGACDTSAASRGADSAAAPAAASMRPLDSAVANDNRIAGGRMRRGVRHMHLEIRRAAWRPDGDVDSMATVFAFGEAGGATRIPGPLLRATQGTEVRLTVSNTLTDSTAVVHGLRAGSDATADSAFVDTLQIAPGATREVRFRADRPGTYLYWGTTTNSPIRDRPWRDSQLSGAIVVDPPDAMPDPAERIFVITILDLYPDDTVHNRAKEDVWEVAINGRSWPHTERLEVPVGDTARWRWVNASYISHPMHLHGFHFRVTAKGTGQSDTVYAPAQERLAVTELMNPGTTFAMAWTPTRAGTWLMHCHMAPHITPFPVRPDSVLAHDLHDVEQHALQGMAGLVLGITARDKGAAPPAPVIAHRLRLFAQQAPTRVGKSHPRGFVVERHAEPRADSIDIPGAPLVLVRGETHAITVRNRLPEPTTVHWHGMELESVYDGVAGWSRTGSSIAPLVAPGDSFVAVMTPPRAGTFIYHTHMDEGLQLRTGMYGPLIVLEPGERFDPSTDLVFMLGGVAKRDTIGEPSAPAVNGSRSPASRTLAVGTRYRLRFVNILPAAPATFSLVEGDTPVTWTIVGKDGASIGASQRARTAARVHFGVGETYDVEWTPANTGTLELRFGIDGNPRAVVQRLVVR